MKLRPDALSRPAPVAVAEVDLIRIAARVTRDLDRPRALIYWSDLAASVVLGYGGLAVALVSASAWLVAAGAIVAVLALYRAGSFIHELTHLKSAALPGFRTAWNLLVGVPLLIPSFMYESVHNLHHTRIRYGTDQDPEYLPLALMRPATLLTFVVAAAAAPLALLIRYALLAPLSALSPALRRHVVERYSSLSINPAFRRRLPEGAVARDWLVLETLASLWAMLLIAGAVTGVISLRAVVTVLLVVSGVMVLNQVRTLVAHLWENDGEPISVTAQYLDTVNVPPPGLLPALWAPVGLRYHALHHLLPGVPYHSLGEAHRRLAEATPVGSDYHRANHAGLPGLVSRLVASSYRGGPLR